jgi:hypothetical protein
MLLPGSLFLLLALLLSEYLVCLNLIDDLVIADLACLT